MSWKDCGASWKIAVRSRVMQGECELAGTAAGIYGIRRLGAAGSSAPKGSPRALP
ncbi:MAG: hypothetical protein IJK75_06690 [Bacteroidales bacterium]|nr:hypothetical protein [Bacteroidales bacterium]